MIFSLLKDYKFDSTFMNVDVDMSVPGLALQGILSIVSQKISDRN
jgi:hypothetical protein